MGEGKKGKILLIEDDASLVEMYKLKFTEEGYDIETATKGVEGLELAQKGKHDIILLDIILPEMDGFAVLRKLKEEKNTKNTPIIMLSNLGQESDIKKGQELGAQDYLLKADFTPAQVVDKVQEVLKKGKK